MAADRSFEFNADQQGLTGDAIIDLYVIDLRTGVNPLPSQLSTGGDYANAYAVCYINQPNVDYGFSDVVNGLGDSICDDPTDAAFNPGTVDYDNADVEPRNQIATGAPISEVFYLCNWTQTSGISVRFAGDVYVPIPMQTGGFEIRNEGVPPNPTITVANIGLEMTGLINSYKDMLGAKVFRRRVLAKHLDDGTNPDPSARWPDEVWLIQQKSSENKLAVSFSLSTPFDLDGVSLPRRRALRYACPWVYRGAECGYTGPPVADLKDQPTGSPSEDKCGKRVSSCRLRYPNGQDLPFGGFPGLTL